MTQKEIDDINAEYEALRREEIEEWTKERFNGIEIWRR